MEQRAEIGDVRERLGRGERVVLKADLAVNEVLRALGSGIRVGGILPGEAHPMYPHVDSGVRAKNGQKERTTRAAREVSGGVGTWYAGEVVCVAAEEKLHGGVLAVEPEWTVASRVKHAEGRHIDSIEVVQTSPNEWPECPVEYGCELESEDMMRHLRRSARVLPESVVDSVMRFGEAPPPCGALLLKGCPVGEIGLTPDTPTGETTKDLTSEWVLLSVSRLLGQAVGYLPEHGGSLVQNICPTKSGADRQVSTSSKVTLMYHTEASFHPWRPRWLLLSCLRGDENAKTTLASVRDIERVLKAETVAVLRESRFRTGIDESYAGGRSSALSEKHPVVYGRTGGSYIRYDAELTRGEDEESREALVELNKAIAECEGGVVLESGDIVILDNAVVVHGRSPFKPRFDGYDRWLQRAFVVPDLMALAGETEGRIVSTNFMP